jgi:hypothetical protein
MNDIMSDESFQKAVFEIAAESSKEEFKPFMFPNVDGDCVEVFMSQSCYYAKWIDPHLTLYLEEGTDKIVGYCITGISRIWSKYLEAEKHENSQM